MFNTYIWIVFCAFYVFHVGFLVFNEDKEERISSLINAVLMFPVFSRALGWW
jgi:hypothetical protein